MSIGKINPRPIVSIPSSASVYLAVKLMHENNIGNVIVVDDENNSPIGILTDRDIAMKVVFEEVDPEEIDVGDIMTDDLLVLKKHQGINECIEMMSAKGVRRAPIIDDDNKLCGIVTIDDLLILISEELNSLAKIMRKQDIH